MRAKAIGVCLISSAAILSLTGATGFADLPEFDLIPEYVIPGVTVHKVIDREDERVVVYAMVAAKVDEETVILNFEEAKAALEDEEEVTLLTIGTVVQDDEVQGNEEYLQDFPSISAFEALGDPPPGPCPCPCCNCTTRQCTWGCLKTCYHVAEP